MNYPELLKKIDAFIAEHRQEMLADLAALVEVPSVAIRSGSHGMPYGENCQTVMYHTQAIAEKLGFVTKIVDNAILTVEYGGKPVQFGILAHLDVVDAGEGWNTPPYQMILDGDTLHGRGVADDKGAAVASLYAMKAAREICPDLPYSPMAWLGTAEEIGSPDLKNYLRHSSLPRYNLTPDATDPIVIGEGAKHRPAISAEWEASDAQPQVVYLQGGKVRNAIPAYAEALIAGMTAAEAEALATVYREKTEVEFLLKDTAEGLMIRASGRGAHINHPLSGRNGQTALVGLLSQLPLADCASTATIRALAKVFPYGDLAGAALGLTVRDDIMGAPRVNFTTCKLTTTGFFGQFDSRGPTNATPENFAHVIDRALREAGFTVEEAEMDGAHYVPETEPIVSMVKELYRGVRGYDAKCCFILGASYAHFVDGAIATGRAAPGIDTKIHKANECLPLDDFDKMVSLYTLAILRLCSENPF